MKKILSYISLLWCVLLAQGGDAGISFALVGDIMLGSDYNDQRCPAPDEVDFFEDARSYLLSADVAMGNLEGPITTSTNCTKNTEAGKVYAFRMPPYLAKHLARAGFDVLNTANNHSNDFGISGRMDTEKILDSLGIAHTGRFGDIAVIDVRGRKIAVIGFTINRGNFSLLDVDLASSLVRALDKFYGLVVVTFHGGAEGAKNIHLKDGDEYFLGENRGNLKIFAHKMVDAGADIVFGHGPHIPRAVEIYKNRLIAYSLGNFCTWYGINVSGVSGLAPLITAQIDNTTGELLSMDIISFEQQSRHYPKLDAQQRAKKLMIKLSEEDIGKSPFDFKKNSAGEGDKFSDEFSKNE